ncbi:MAG: hypothetical protein GY750_08440 [Lentisphaerae bacterium]|nr:hypothetical protein [Lentisphaerota bacterium]MCP4101438.1 hypothetical protein [Lentisphaerota bacterium]
MQNPGFEQGLQGWEIVSGKDSMDVIQGSSFHEASCLRLTSGGSVVKVKQDIAVKPKTMYTCALRMRLNRNDSSVPLSKLAGMFEIKGDTQRNTANNSRFNKLVMERLDWAGADQENVWLEKRTIFYTAKDAKTVTLSLAADKGNAGFVDFDSVRLVEGSMATPFEYSDVPRMRPVLPKVEPAGVNMLKNSDFSKGKTNWLTSGVVGVESVGIQLTSGELTARTIQDVPVFLAPNTRYKLNFDCICNDAVADIIFRSPESEWRIQANNSNWERQTLEFITPDKFVKGKVILQVYKKQSGSVIFVNVGLASQG